ncbi:MAG: hypothetical protein NTY61_03735, partial [Candidatus Parcubacteria bacterium]|nr:hypothetical protein [Candidatus Parcubacteria bacterium]
KTFQFHVNGFHHVANATCGKRTEIKIAKNKKDIIFFIDLFLIIIFSGMQKAHHQLESCDPIRVSTYDASSDPDDGIFKLDAILAVLLLPKV